MKRSLLQTSCFSLGLLILYGFVSVVLAHPGSRVAASVAIVIGCFALIVRGFAWAMHTLWILSGRVATAMTSAQASKAAGVEL